MKNQLRKKKLAQREAKRQRFRDRLQGQPGGGGGVFRSVESHDGEREGDDPVDSTEFVFEGFAVTYDALEDATDGIARAARVLAPHAPEKIYEQITAGKATDEHVRLLDQALERDPDLPHLWNWKMMALTRMNRDDEARVVMAETARRFPTYFFGRLQMAMQLLNEKKVDEFEAFVGPTKTLRTFVGCDRVVHISEVGSYQQMMMMYHYLKREFEQALKAARWVIDHASPGSVQHDGALDICDYCSFALRVKTLRNEVRPGRVLQTIRNAVGLGKQR
jgi:hypothetical protein